MKLKYGIFLDRNVEYGDHWDSMPIGARAFTLRTERENAETARFEYYYINDSRTFIVKNPTFAEKMLAQTTRKTGKNVVGYRNESYVVKDTKELREILAKESESQEPQNI